MSDRLKTAREGTITISRPELKPFFTPKTLAEYFSISERTVRQMIADGRIESVRVEGQRRIMLEDVHAYVARNRTIRR